MPSFSHGGSKTSNISNIGYPDISDLIRRSTASIELRHLRYFLAVAEHRNFSRAAEALGTAQPSLSQQIRDLEREIGFELFDRGTRHVELTPAGEAFVPEAQAILTRLDVAVTHARDAGRGKRGELRVVYTISAMMTMLPAAIRAFRAASPDIRLTFEVVNPVEAFAALRERRADVAVVLGTGAQVPSQSPEVRVVARIPMGVMLPADHRLAGRATIAVEELANEAFVLYARGLAEIYDVALAFCREHGVEPRRIEQVDRMETILGLVSAGDGISLVPRIYDRLAFAPVVYAALDPEPDPFTILAARSATAHPVLAEAFISTCVAVASR